MKELVRKLLNCYSKTFVSTPIMLPLYTIKFTVPKTDFFWNLTLVGFGPVVDAIKISRLRIHKKLDRFKNE